MASLRASMCMHLYRAGINQACHCCCLQLRSIFFILIFLSVLLIGSLSVHDFQAFLLTLNQPIKVTQNSLYLHTTQPSEDGIPLSGFTVNTPGCQIPDFDPFDKSIRHLVKKTSPIPCKGRPPMTYVDGEWLRINITAVDIFYNEALDHCEYQEILRPRWYEENPDDRYSYNQTLVSFITDIKMTTPFIRLSCYSKKGENIYTNFHAFILTKQKLEQEADRKFQTFKTQSYPKETLNVLALGIDSMSRLNFMRQMPRTRDYILKNLQGVELKGMNKVADNTFVTLVPIFTGKFVKELPYNETMLSKPFDNFTFLWQNFSDHGYRTLFAEDAPRMAAFNMGKEGFHKEPVDHYLRPFSLALENSSLWINQRLCGRKKLETEIVLDYLKEFITRFEKKPYFAVLFLAGLTHDYVNRAGRGEDLYFEFFKWMNRTGNLNSTVVIFFSDHGIRFGPIRETNIGKLEERLPFGYIVVPPWFSNKYPVLWKNLRANQNRLTTPFDYHETLKDLLVFDGREKHSSVNDRGISLFSNIPIERTCEHAEILPHWCTCHQKQPISLHDTTVRKATDAAIGYINNKIAHNISPCAVLNLKNITDALKFVSNDRVLTFKKSYGDSLGGEMEFGERTEALVDYLITFQVTPGNGMFEATVRHSTVDNQLEVVGDISRINKYGNTADCMPDHSLQKYCYCL